MQPERLTDKLNNLLDHVSLGIKIVKKKQEPHKQGCIYYLRIFIANEEVTFYVARALDKNMSSAKDMGGTLIMRGGSMDAAFYWIQHEISNMAKEAGIPGVFHDRKYIII